MDCTGVVELRAIVGRVVKALLRCIRIDTVLVHTMVFKTSGDAAKRLDLAVALRGRSIGISDEVNFQHEHGHITEECWHLGRKLVQSGPLAALAIHLGNVLFCVCEQDERIRARKDVARKEQCEGKVQVATDLEYSELASFVA